MAHHIHVVLTDDIPNLGKSGELVRVRPGFARNYLVPRGLAIIPSEHNLRLLERYKIRVQKALDARIADLQALARQIEGYTVQEPLEESPDV